MSYNKVQISKNPGLHKEISYIHYYNSPLGRITLASNGNALTGLWFDGQKYFGSTLAKEYIPKDLPVFGQASHWLDIYFSGKAPGFTPLLSLNTTPFRESVWEIMLKIPFGQTMSYKEIALKNCRTKRAWPYVCTCSWWCSCTQSCFLNCTMPQGYRV